MERNRGPGLDDAREEYLKRRRISSNLLLRSDMERGEGGLVVVDNLMYFLVSITQQEEK